MNAITTSSVKLQFNNVIEIQPWVILSLLGEEFVTTNDDVTGFEQVGLVRFGKVDGKILRSDVIHKEPSRTYYIQLEDGRLYSLTNLY